MAEQLIKRGNIWYYRYTDASGKRVMRKGCTDKRVTMEMAANAICRVARVKEGVVDEREYAYKDHGARPLSEHFASWEQALVARGAKAKHVDLFTARAKRVVALLMGARLADIEPYRSNQPVDAARAAANLAARVEDARLSDVTEERAQQALAALKKAGRSLTTCNHHKAAIKSFAKWCYDTHRTREDTLRGVRGYNAKEDRRHDRRTIGVEELQHLVEITARGPVVLGVSGPVRALCYRLAATTGLRYGEIGSITPASFNWAAPSVTVRAAYTKNGQVAELPLLRDLADDLKRHVATLPAGRPVFDLPAEQGAKMLKHDLRAANIPYRDDADLVFDFHALRCELATLLDSMGVSPRVVQRLMRHSTLELTGRYTRPRAVDIEAAASKLPSLKPTGDHPQDLAATGTDGTIHEQTLAPPVLPNTTVEGRGESPSVMMTGSDVQELMEGKPLKIGDFVADGRPESPTVADAAKATRRNSNPPATARSSAGSSGSSRINSPSTH
jgi:integrase